MRKNITLLLFLTISLLTNAQKFQIKGKLHDSQGGELPYATVLLLNAKDSTMVNYALSDTKGDFIIKDVPRNNYLLKVTFIGYFAKTFEITPPASVVLDLGIIRMQEESQLLQEVMVKEERIPMKVKHDTLEYDVLAFKPKANEVVEDLIKRMPGIEVATDGSITAQGEQVKRVTVDGKEFFGRDPKMATQNLPADAIAKVQVFDQKSEKAQFTGIDDGQKERTMNLELKDDRKEGAFGNS
ncbi:MAG: carboxypeptidase-like regulatory domain-containing protein, partial [Bacteroidales bacterium]|nr:carboxypeptidase-like regulatory domain-containing protein [Bacteroidales bacterium]